MLKWSVAARTARREDEREVTPDGSFAERQPAPAAPNRATDRARRSLQIATATSVEKKTLTVVEAGGHHPSRSHEPLNNQGSWTFGAADRGVLRNVPKYRENQPPCRTPGEFRRPKRVTRPPRGHETRPAPVPLHRHHTSGAFGPSPRPYQQLRSRPSSGIGARAVCTRPPQKTITARPRRPPASMIRSASAACSGGYSPTTRNCSRPSAAS